MKQSKNQELYRSMFVGILLYTVVLGFFNDYTDILVTTSYSVTFFMAIVMQLLTYATFEVKDIVKKKLGKKEGTKTTVSMVIGVWLVLFFSKFVFLAVIDFIFQEDVYISGFFGLMAIVVCLTIVQKVSEKVYANLAD
jgi:L-asparagine transporter-like permease